VRALGLTVFRTDCAGCPRVAQIALAGLGRDCEMCDGLRLGRFGDASGPAVGERSVRKAFALGHGSSGPAVWHCTAVEHFCYGAVADIVQHPGVKVLWKQ
jgi:hypothetical protein